jgi:ketosteroid isomerase-like protein
MPSQPQSTEQLVDLIRQGVLPAAGTEMDGDGMLDLMTELLRQAAHPEFVTSMVDQTGRAAEYEGIAGFREGLSDFMSPYDRYRLRIDEVIEVEDALVFLVRQIGVTKHGGVEVESPGATVWWLEDGSIRQAAFYIDQQAALKAAGIDPGRRSGD